MHRDTVTDSDVRVALRSEARRELLDRVMPYLAAHCIDEERGGFLGFAEHGAGTDADGPSSLLLNARIFWIFATAARSVDAAYLPVATRAYDHLRARFWDAERGGAYWSLTPAGDPLDTRKMTYGQAFLLYGLCAYYDTTRDPSALSWAQRQFGLIETHALDTTSGTYRERFDVDWSPLPGQRHSDQGPVVETTTNTLLRLLEAYTALYQVWRKPHVEARLHALLMRFLDTVIDPSTHHLRMAFDAAWQPAMDLVSYGHDIEASWLLMRAADALRDDRLQRRVRERAAAMAGAVRHDGVAHDGALIYASTSAHRALDRHWWPQSEAVVGFLNAEAMTGDRAYLEAAAGVWQYIQLHFVDRTRGGWYARVNREGAPYAGEPSLGRGKGVYHHARACLEVLRRIPA